MSFLEGLTSSFDSRNGERSPIVAVKVGFVCNQIKVVLIMTLSCLK